MRIPALVALFILAPAVASGAVQPLPGPTGFRDAGLEGIRGITIGPIENGYHPGRGYGSAAYVQTLAECKQMGATWISLTPFGRVFDLNGSGVDPTFESPIAVNRDDIRRAIDQAHAFGLKVFLVPHLWVESLEWRARINPKTAEGWRLWEASYHEYVMGWARVAEESHAELFSLGVELRSWVTTAHAGSFNRIVRDVRSSYRGLLTYSANWDDADSTVILGDLDLIGINAFYPLAESESAEGRALISGGERVRAQVRELAERWQKPVMFTELGYGTRPGPAVKPWEWPDKMSHVRIDERAQADAYRGLLAPMLDEPTFAGFFVWRVYADPNDVSQEAEWGFSPRRKMAEWVMRDAFAVSWAGESPWSHFPFIHAR